MDLRPLPPEETAVRRYVEELWLPYHRELEATVERHALADDVDLVDEEVEFRLDRLAAEDYDAWVAIEGASDDGDLATAGGALTGFVTAELDDAPSVFDRPDRVIVGDLYVREPYRGTGLATDLVGIVAEHARERGCTQVELDVDVDNERAIAFYEKLGFEPVRRRMAIDVEDL